MEKRKKVLLLFSFCFAAASLVLNVVQFAWYSDKGFEFQIGLDLLQAKGILEILQECLWLSAPIAALVSLWLTVRQKAWNDEPRLLPLHAVPIGLYYLFQLLLFVFRQKEAHPSICFTAASILLISFLTLAAARHPELRVFVCGLIIAHIVAETALAAATLLLHEKWSTFTFSQTILWSHYSSFVYSFMALSVFLSLILLQLSLLCHLFAPRVRTVLIAKNETPSEELPEDDDITEEENSDSLPEGITLQDLGIDR